MKTAVILASLLAWAPAFAARGQSALPLATGMASSRQARPMGARQASSAPRPRGPLAPDHVAGRVVSASDGHGIPRAFVSLQDPRSGQSLAGVQADAEGRYQFPPQPVGKYSLHASAAGYLGSAYQEHHQFSTAIVLGAGLATDALNLVLTPAAVITGRVLDESGDPVQRAQITLYRERPGGADASTPAGDDAGDSPIQRTRGMQTGDDGTFEFDGVAPGRFYISASAQPWYAVHPVVEQAIAPGSYRPSIDPALDVAYPELFYPSSTDPAGATPITIKPGDHVSANFVMQPEHAATLTFRFGTDPANRSVPQLTRTVFGVTEQVPAQYGGGDGKTLTMTGIAPGRYGLQTLVANGRLRQSAGDVDLSSGSATMDMPSAAAGDSAAVHVRLRSANGTPLPDRIQFNLRPARAGQPGMIGERVSDKNEVDLAAVPAGNYRFVIYADNREMTVTGLSVQGKAVSNRRLQVSGGNDLQVDLTVTAYAPAIEGFARQGGKGVGGSMVVLVPAGADTSTDLYRRDQSDLDGSFELRDVVPGNYLLVALDDGWKLPRWNDAAALAPYLTHALPFTVSVGASAILRVAEPLEVQPLR